jgi:hypothetical protein
MNMSLKFDDLARLVNEDATAMSNKWATGISGRFQGHQQLNLVDLLKRGDDQHPNNVKAPAGMPHSMQSMVQLLGDLYLQVEQVKMAIQIAHSNPILEEREGSLESLEEMYKKLLRVEKIVLAVSEDIDNFSIPNTEPSNSKKNSKKQQYDKAEKFKKRTLNNSSQGAGSKL